jgi:hypothetical protein
LVKIRELRTRWLVAFAHCSRRDGGRRRCAAQPARYAASAPGDRSGPDRRVIAKLCAAWSALVSIARPVNPTSVDFLRRGAVTIQPAMSAPDAKRLAPQKDTRPLRKALCKCSATRAQRRLVKACITDEGKYLTRRRRADPAPPRHRELERSAVHSCATSRDLARLFHFRLRRERPDAQRAHERSAKNLERPHLIHSESQSAFLLLPHSLWWWRWRLASLPLPASPTS